MRKMASALGYSKGDPSPALLVSGRGREAEIIIKIAEEAGVAVIEDEALAVLLDTWSAGGSNVKPGEYIPYWCWEAAAKALAFVLKSEKNHT